MITIKDTKYTYIISVSTSPSSVLNFDHDDDQMTIMPDDIIIIAPRRKSTFVWSLDYSDQLSSLVVVNTNVNKVDEI